MAETGETTVIGSDTHIKGELTFEKTARVSGKVDGKITGKGDLHVGDGALCKADVAAGSVHVDGVVEGNVNARDTVKLNAKGTVRGDIVAAKMVMAEGASFFGQCAVGPDAQKQAGRTGEPSTASTPQTPPAGQGQKR